MKGISKNKNSYTARFWNPITKETIVIGTWKEEQTAIDELNSAILDFYSENDWLLPSSIGINKTRWVFHIRVKISGRTRELFKSKNLEEVLEERKSIINKLI